jgi:uncharacterized protein (DUF2236 family)
MERLELEPTPRRASAEPIPRQPEPIPRQPEPIPRQPEPVPPEVMSVLGHFGLSAGNANVVMQLARLPVGHGLALSRVDSGRVDKHPIKRLRTTASYLAISLLGTDEERRAMRQEVNRAHAAVRSGPGDPVPCSAFDPELQLWVAACLYWGTVDIYRRLHGRDLAPDRAEVLLRYARRLGTTLQVPEEMWPASTAAFEAYWQDGLSRIEMDDLTRRYLQGLAQLEFLVAPLGRLGAPLRPLLRPLDRFLTLGYLPEVFRGELGLPWSRTQQRLFDAHIRIYAAITRQLPARLRQYPMNVYLADARRLIRRGRAIV